MFICFIHTTIDKYKYHPDIPSVVEGDILLSSEQAAIFKTSGWKGLLQSEAWRDVRMWNTIIPYEIDSDVGQCTSCHLHNNNCYCR